MIDFIFYWMICGVLTILAIYLYSKKFANRFYLLTIHLSNGAKVAFLILAFIGGFLFIPFIIFRVTIRQLIGLFYKIMRISK